MYICISIYSWFFRENVPFKFCVKRRVSLYSGSSLRIPQRRYFPTQRHNIWSSQPRHMVSYIGGTPKWIVFKEILFKWMI